MNRHLRRLSWFGAFSGLAIPGYSTFFQKLVPPLFPEIGLITACLGAATVFIVYSRRPRKQSGAQQRRLTTRGTVLLASSVLLLAAFLLTLRAWTVQDPQQGTTYQIGYRTAEWTLTTAGLTDLKNKPSATPEDLMLMEAAFYPGGPAKIWVSWSIYTAGLLVLLFYLLGFILWAAAFATLAVVARPGELDAQATPESAPQSA